MRIKNFFLGILLFWGMLQSGFAAVEKFEPKNDDEKYFYSFITECVHGYRGYRGDGSSAAYYLKDVQKAFLKVIPARQKELLAYVDNSGWTALHAFARANKYVEFFFLLRLGADLTLKTARGETPYDIACRSDSYAVEQLIKIHTAFEEAKKAAQKHKKNKAQKIGELYTYNSLAIRSCINLLISLSEEQKNFFLSDEQVLFNALNTALLHDNYKPLFIVLYLQPYFSEKVYKDVGQPYFYQGTKYILLKMYQLCFQPDNKEKK